MEFRILGPVEVYAGGHVWEVGPPQRRHTLAALLADAGRPVTTEALLDRVWDDPPLGARRALQVHVTQIRRLLERAGAAGESAPRLVRRSGGYVLDIDADQVDLHRFLRLAHRARTPATAEAAALALLREARALWRGEPLTGLTGTWANHSRQAWRQQYLETTVAWANAELGSGNHAEVIGPLSELTADHPLMESLAAVLMRALHAAGRPAEALEFYATVRRHLVEELGADPSAELQAVHQGILRGDVAIAAAPVRPTTPPAVVPAQLPADVSGFAGRVEHLATLDALLAGSTGGASTAVVISAVSGTAGVGKTALAVHWGHTVADRFPDGQLYVNLRGYDPGGRMMSPSEAVRGFLDALGVPAGRIPSAVDAQAALYRSLLAGKRVLVLVDNAYDAEQVRPLLPGTPSAMVVVTSRNQLTGLLAADAAHPVVLDVLSATEARDLLIRRLGTDRVAAEPDAVREIIAACARLPLALSIVVARARQTGFPLAALAAELGETGQQLDALDAGDPASDVRAVFSWSYAALSAPAAQLFRLLGLHPGPDISTRAAAGLTGDAVAGVRRLLTELTRANLLAERLPGRYTFHDLLRAYATDLVHEVDPEPVRRTATRRLLDHYLHSGYAADRLLDPPRDPIPLPLAKPEPGAAAERFADHRQAMAWLCAEHTVLLSVVRVAAEAGLDARTWQLVWSLETFLYRQGHWHDQSVNWRAGLYAADLIGDPTVHADSHRGLALTYIRLGRHVEAHYHFERALEFSTQIGDRVGQARTHYSLAWAYGRKNDLKMGIHHAQQALVLHQSAGHDRGQAKSLNAVGWYQALLGQYAPALAACQESLALMEKLNDREGQAAVWDSLGYAHHHAGQLEQALDCYRHAGDLYCELGDRYGEASTLTYLGDTCLADDDPGGARAAWEQALRILTDLDHPDAQKVREKLRGLDAGTAGPPG